MPALLDPQSVKLASKSSHLFQIETSVGGSEWNEQNQTRTEDPFWQRWLSSAECTRFDHVTGARAGIKTQYSLEAAVVTCFLSLSRRALCLWPALVNTVSTVLNNFWNGEALWHLTMQTAVKADSSGDGWCVYIKLKMLALFFSFGMEQLWRYMHFDSRP